MERMLQNLDLNKKCIHKLSWVSPGGNDSTSLDSTPASDDSTDNLRSSLKLLSLATHSILIENAMLNSLILSACYSPLIACNTWGNDYTVDL